MTTREKIMAEALNQFSVKGFDTVSVRDIAYAVGIKESSLYNHFKNKQDIFDSIVEEYTRRWDAFFEGMRLAEENKPMSADQATVDMYKNMSEKEFSAVAGAMFDFYMSDDVNVKLRRMLTIEQYKSEKVAALFRKISFEDSIGFQTQLFKEFMKLKLFKEADPYVLALEFFAPIFLLFYKYSNDKDSVIEAKDLFDKHIRQFVNTYTLR